MLMVERKALQRRALILVWVGFAWNFIEAAVALWSAFSADSVALLAFGLDSLVEIFAGAVLIWRLGKNETQQEEKAEKKALKTVGVTFFMLAVFVVLQSSATLTGFLVGPQESPIGIVLVVVSALVMTSLFLEKARVAKKLGSRALRAEAVESLMCDLQDLTLLFGLGLNILFGWWWADPVAALLLVPFLLKEGWESIS
jgi:divalent metal cation (Fe/Co/Zn/Cd) transporter